MELKLKGVTKELKKGFGKGVLAIKDITFKDVEDTKDPMLWKAVMEQESEFIEKIIEVRIYEVKDNRIDPKKPGMDGVE